MRRRLSIGIAGCGIGGMAAALMLSKAGHSVTVFDQFSKPEPIGSGLVVQPVGLAVLQELGVAQAVLSCGHKIYKMFGTESDSGRAVLNVDYGPVNGDTFGIGIHRASLFDALYKAVKTSAVNIIGGQRILATERAAAQRVIISEDGQRFGGFDLVIDAAGARSPLSPIKSRPLDYGALWGTVPWPETTYLPLGRLSQCYQKANHMMGVLPLGTLPGSDIQSAAVFWSEPRKTLSEWYSSDLDAWKSKAISLWPAFEPFIEQIKSHDDMTAASYSHGTLWRPYGELIVHIGDSAHQASPQLGQGANMALLDAQALARAIGEYEDMGMALSQYAVARRYHVGLYQLFSSVFTPFYQSDSRVLPKLRDNVMNPVSQIWPIKPMLTRLVCGNFVQP